MVSSLFHERINNHISVFEEMGADDNFITQTETVANDLLESLQAGGALYLCGNGGSAADAQHIATEFVSRFYKERRAINAEALTVNTSSLTAIANDYDFDRVFSRQLEAKAHEGDFLIGISTSGTSRNVIRAMEYASSHGVKTALLTGSATDNKIESLCAYVIRIPSEDTPRIQEGHIFLGHMLAEYIEANIDN